MEKQQVVEQLALEIEKEIDETVKNEVDTLKQTFYKLKRVETEAAKKAFVEAGGEEKDWKPEEDSTEQKLKELLNAFRDKRATLVAQEEKVKEENWTLKKAIIEKFKALTEEKEEKEDFHKSYLEFKELQQQWKEIKQVPQAAVNELWKDYQFYSEKFYDLLKINNEMRDYDFKKNLELKQALSEAAERLADEPDVVSAFYQLQNLHQEWREIGPVAREIREEVWARFKQASSIINKKHQDYFESLRANEQQNLDAKIALCEKIEAINYALLTNFKTWDEKNKEVLDAQNAWKSLGFAPKKENVKIFERFRAACDLFFKNKSEFFKELKDDLEANLDKKKALVEQAEALKDSQEWKETSDKLIALQKEWKTIGSVSRKHSDAIWKRFVTACDYFFEQKNLHFSSQKSEETENLKKKKTIIEQIKSLDESLAANEAVAQLRQWISQFNAVGFVPFKEKDKVYKEFREAVDKHFDRLKVHEADRRLQSFKSNLGSGEQSKNRLLSERERLIRTHERIKADIQTYENNIGFLTSSSKKGNSLVNEVQRKIESLKGELELIEKKIKVIEENLGF